MPELPDVELYLHCLRSRLLGERVERVTIASPFVLRSFDPSIDVIEGRTVRTLSRLGKRIVIGLEPDFFLVVHLMIAGRFRWYDAGAKAPGRPRFGLAALAMPTGTLWLTEASTKKRASIHLVRGEAALGGHDRGGLDVIGANRAAFAGRLRTGNRTLRRAALTDPRLFSGIGNAYSDEILHRAHLSPLALTRTLTDDAVHRLHDAAVATLTDWTDRLREEIGDGFPGPGAVTAFRPGMAVHGRYGEPCPECGATVQRIRYAENETNYCPHCQTHGRLLADRSLSRLLRDDWPRKAAERPGGGGETGDVRG